MIARRCVTLLCATLVVWACSCGIKGRIPAWIAIRVPQAQAATDPALAWARRYDAWQAHHGGHDRILYIVSHQAAHGLQGVEAKDASVLKGKTTVTCMWFVIRVKPRTNPLSQVVNAGLEDCVTFDAHYRESTKRPPAA